MAKKLVVAGSFRQAVYWAGEMGWSGKNEWKYVVNQSSLQGYHEGTEIHFVGEWWRHPANKNEGLRDTIKRYLVDERLVRVEHDPDTGEVKGGRPTDPRVAKQKREQNRKRLENF